MNEKKNVSILDRVTRAHSILKKHLECTICLDIVSDLCLTKCGHFFCQTCTTNLMKERGAKCPLCKNAINRRTVIFNQDMSECALRLNALTKAIDEDITVATYADYIENSSKKEEFSTIQESTVAQLPEQNAENETNNVLMLTKKQKSSIIKNKKSSDVTSVIENTDSEIQATEKVTAWLKDKHQEDDDLLAIPSTSFAYLQPEKTVNKQKMTRVKKSRRINKNNKKDVDLINVSHKNTRLPKSAPKDFDKNTSTSLTLDPTKRNWSQVVQFGKEMRKKSAKTKSLHIIVESANKSQTLNCMKLSAHEDYNKNKTSDCSPIPSRLSQKFVISKNISGVVDRIDSDNDTYNDRSTKISTSREKSEESTSLDSSFRETGNISLANLNQDQVLDIIGVTLTPENKNEKKNVTDGNKSRDNSHGSSVIHSEKESPLKKSWLTKAERVKMSLKASDLNKSLQKESTDFLKFQETNNEQNFSQKSTEVPKKANIFDEVMNKSDNIGDLLSESSTKLPSERRSMLSLKKRKSGNIIQKSVQNDVSPKKIIDNSKPANESSSSSNTVVKRLSLNSPLKRDLTNQRLKNSMVPFQKLGKMFKQRRSIPFYYHGLVRKSMNRTSQNTSYYFNNLFAETSAISKNNAIEPVKLVQNAIVPAEASQTSIQINFVSDEEAPTQRMEINEQNIYEQNDNDVLNDLNNKIENNFSDKRVQRISISSSSSSNTSVQTLKRKRIIPLPEEENEENGNKMIIHFVEHDSTLCDLNKNDPHIMGDSDQSPPKKRIQRLNSNNKVSVMQKKSVVSSAENLHESNRNKESVINLANNDNDTLTNLNKNSSRVFSDFDKSPAKKRIDRIDSSSSCESKVSATNILKKKHTILPAEATINLVDNDDNTRKVLNQNSSRVFSDSNERPPKKRIQRIDSSSSCDSKISITQTSINKLVDSHKSKKSEKEIISLLDDSDSTLKNLSRDNPHLFSDSDQRIQKFNSFDNCNSKTSDEQTLTRKSVILQKSKTSANKESIINLIEDQEKEKEEEEEKEEENKNVNNVISSDESPPTKRKGVRRLNSNNSIKVDLTSAKRKRSTSTLDSIEINPELVEATLNSWYERLPKKSRFTPDLTSRKSVDDVAETVSVGNMHMIETKQQNDDIVCSTGFKSPPQINAVIENNVKIISENNVIDDNFDQAMADVDTQLLAGGTINQVQRTPPNNRSLSSNLQKTPERSIQMNASLRDSRIDILRKTQSKQSSPRSIKSGSSIDDDEDQVLGSLNDIPRDSKMTKFGRKDKKLRPGNNSKSSMSKPESRTSTEERSKHDQMCNSVGNTRELNVQNRDEKRGSLNKSFENNVMTILPEPVKSSIVNSKQQDRAPFEDSLLMNITQEQYIIQQLEQDLLGSAKNEFETSNNGQIMMGSGSEKNQKQMSDINLIKNSVEIEHMLEKEASNRYLAENKSEDLQTADTNSDEDDIVENTPRQKIKLSTKQFSQTSTPSMKHLTPTDLSPIPNIMKQQTLITPSVSNLSKEISEMSNKIAIATSKTKLYHSTPKLSEKNSSHSITFKRQNMGTINEIVETYDETKKTGVATAVDEIAQKNNEQELRYFICSGLTLAQIDLVKRLAEKFGARYLSTFNPDVTHVIVKTQEHNAAEITLKYLQGVAYRKWVLSIKWVIDSMRENKLLAEESYEVVDVISKEMGPRKSRLGEKGIFEDFAFLCMGPFSSITVKQCEELIQCVGGTVVQSLEELAVVKGKLKMIIVQEDIHNGNTIFGWYKKTNAVPVVQDWVTESISQYKPIPLPCYVQELTPSDIIALGFPKELLEDEDLDSLNEEHS